jgi:pimeloyl-ACP methyl ester carboxylesterase
LITYRNDGLRLNALLVKPKNGESITADSACQSRLSPDPPRYGVVDPERNERPGKYYGAIPTSFARRGYAVIMADYRGHNTSEGYDFTRLPNAPDLYATDVLALLRALKNVEGLRSDCVFVWGHSMGAHVSLRTIQTYDGVRAVSLWSLASPIKDWSMTLDPAHPTAGRDPSFCRPIAVAPVANSRNLESLLRSRGVNVDSRFENSTLHYFEGELFERTIESDTQFFSAHARDSSCSKN